MKIAYGPYPARLHVVLAREAPIAVILRRGPSKWTRAILWHTDTDQFEGGQWLRGRIREDWCALSPDGSLFLYFAMQYHRWMAGYGGTWYAISKPPYLTALALWPSWGTWGGSGEFIDNRTVCVSMGYRGKAEPHPDHVPPKWLRVISEPTEFTKKDQRTLEQIRAKDWLLAHQSTDNHDSYERRLGDPHIWERTHPSNRQYALRQRYYGYFPRHYPQPSLKKYAFVDHVNNTEIVLEGANWADWDQCGRVIYARDGQIFAQEPEHIGTFARPLADFNDQKFESMPTPDWAAQW